MIPDAAQNPRRSGSRVTPCDHPGPCNDWNHPKTLDEIIAERGAPPLKAEQFRAKWLGVFEPEFWQEVRNARSCR